MEIAGNIVDIINKKIYAGKVVVENMHILQIDKLKETEDAALPYILPGFTDSHIHIESSMLTPRQFARMAVVHGTVATVSDPHEIANVCGLEGVHYMIADGKEVPFKFNFGAPSCVPATPFETAGAALTVAEVDLLMQNPEIRYLSEMMNFPGVLQEDQEVMDKINLAIKYRKPVDGHAPGLKGTDAINYIQAHKGSVTISTDHECFSSEEALGKLNAGMKILIREGSAAKNFEALIPLLNNWEDAMMFCSDDKHPDSLEQGHINELCARAIAKGVDLFKILKAACINPVQHYSLPVGQLKEGDFADFIVVEDLKRFNVLKTYINGILVAEKGSSLINPEKSGLLNNFNCSLKKSEDFIFPATESKNPAWAIEALDGQLITNKFPFTIKTSGNNCISDPEHDVLKIVVVNRYREEPVSKAFIKNFGLKKGAIAGSVAHDSHNIVAVGVDDASICDAVNRIIQAQGGLSYSVQTINGMDGAVLPLPVAGLMTNEDGYAISKQYSAMDRFVKQELGCTLQSPYMTLSFMALLVIPHLKLSDKGLFDGDRFAFV